MPAEYSTIAFGQEAGIATITLNRPSVLNAINVEALDELNAALDRVRDEGTARVLVLTGAGRAFSSGAELGDEMPRDAGEVLEVRCNPCLQRLLALPVPVITAINGLAAGAGCSLALAGDVAIAARSAYFVQAFIKIGLVPDVGSTWMLPRLIGRARAQAMMMLGERIPASQAEQWGMIHKVVDDVDLKAETQALAAQFANGPTVAYALIRQGIRVAMEQSLTETLHMECRNQRLAARSADFAEGVAAFRNKRAAVFKGK